ncbi:unnamed protein product [Xylocopa violacea]|uniref:Uncharacterized protein n=1 Tax=Xylocopa violacea TaxID=135666 RepID=A0ABP1N5G7_XYLVO
MGREKNIDSRLLSFALQTMHRLLFLPIYKPKENVFLLILVDDYCLFDVDDSYFGFVDMATKDIQDLLVEEEVDEADLMEMASLDANQIDFEDASSDEDCAVKNLTLKKIQEGLCLAENLESFFLNTDPSTERSRKFKREL